MTDYTPEHRANVAPADPRRPWKALVAALVAVLAALLADGQDLLPPWAVLIVSALVAGLSTFLVPNPPDPGRS